MHTTYVFEGKLIARQPLSTCSKELKDADARLGANRPLPIPQVQTPKGTRLMFPGTGIRGGFRRALRDVLRDGLIKATDNPTPLSLDEHYFLTLGGIKAKGDEDKSSVTLEAQWRENNPLLSLFGAGAAGVLSFVQGKLSVGNAICVDVSEPLVISGARTNDLYRDRSQVQFLSQEDIETLVARATGNRDSSVIKRAIKKAEADLKLAKKAKDDELIQAAQAQIEELQVELKSVQEESGTEGNSVGMPLAGFKAIPPEAEMSHRMVLSGGNEVELGAMLAMLGRFSYQPLLGAHIAVGCGQVAGQWEVFKNQPDVKPVSIGTISFEPYDSVLTINAPDNGELLKAKAAFLELLAKNAFDLSIPSAK